MLKTNNNRILISFTKEFFPISLVLLFVLKVEGLASLQGENVKLIIILGYMSYFYIQRVFNRLFPRLVSNITYYLILSLCFFESLRGIVQILPSFRLNTLIVPTGDFFYSAPYGGLLVVSISMLMGFYEQMTNLIDKYLIWITVSLSLIPLALTGSRSSWIALIIVLFIYLYKKARIDNVVNKHKWLIIFIPLLLFILYYIKKPSADSRLFINKINLIALANSGFHGNGPSTYAGVYGKYQTKYFLKEIGNIEEPSCDMINDDCNKVVKSLISNPNSFAFSKKTERERLLSDCPDFAYNEFVKIGIEYGLLVLVAFIGLLSFSLYELYDKQSFWRYGLTSLIIFSLFSFPFNYLPFKFILVFLISQGYSLSDGKDKSSLLYESLVFIGIIGVVIMYKHEVQMRNQSMQIWHDNIKWYKNSTHDYILEDGDSITEWYINPSILNCYSEALNQHGYYEKSDSVLSLCLKYDNKPQYYYLLGTNSLMRGDVENAEKFYCSAFMMVPNRLKPLFLLAKLYYDNNDTCSFVKTANFIESFSPKIENEETEQYRQEIRSLIQNIKIPSNDYKE